jgi:branched-chain amino acid aminotransferase
MDIKMEYEETGIKPELPKDLRFGTSFTDKMFIAEYDKDKGWHSAKVKNFSNFCLSPASLVFHYGQEIFEGQKAYKWENGKIALFRPKKNIKRFNRSAERMSMPQIDEEIYMKGLNNLIYADKDWVPQKHDYSLYIRAAMIAVDPILGVRSGTKYLFFIINSPVGPYFVNGFNPVKIWVSDEYVRAVPGGTGQAKTGGNYAASLKAMNQARDNDCAQVLWLDGIERKYVEEVGTMNIFFVENEKLITPNLSGSILKGITRDSIIEYAKHIGVEVEERKIDINDILEGIENKTVTECFGAGTACVISPVGELKYKGKSYVIDNDKVGSITKKIYDGITGIQYGKIKDDFNWIYFVEKNI